MSQSEADGPGENLRGTESGEDSTDVVGSTSGRAGSQRRWWAAGVAVVALAVLGTAVSIALVGNSNSQKEDEEQDKAADTADCEVDELPSDNANGAKTLSPSGEYVAEQNDGESTLLWQGGESTKIDAESSQEIYVNSSGVVASNRGPYDAGDNGTPWVYRDGEVSDLEVPDEADNVVLWGINDDGVIAGAMDTDVPESETEEGTSSRTPVRWEAGSTEAEVLDIEDAEADESAGVDADGAIIGTQVRASVTGPVIWDGDGEGEALQVAPEGENSEPDEEGGEPVDRGSVTDFSGDWFLAKSGKGDLYRLNRDGDGGPEKLKLRRANDIDSDGTVYGLTTEDEAVEGDNGVAKLPTLGKKYKASQINEANEDGSVLIGEVALDGYGEGAVQVRWTCH